MRSLVAGDLVRMLVLQINTGDQVWSFGTHKPDLTWGLTFLRP